MSSYIIDKKSYIRCAGAIAGLSATLHEPLWIYNHVENRNFNDNDYYNLFKWAYEANYKSVCWQYHDDKEPLDTKDYKADFEEYKKIGKQAIYHNLRTELVKEIATFFRSIKYQIEEDNLSAKVSCYLNIVLVEIVNKTVLYDRNTECWGNFELHKPNTEIEDALPFN